MKKYCIFLTVFVLTLSLFTGCGCTPRDETGPAMPTMDTTPTVPATSAPILPTTEPTQEATADTGMAPETGGGMNGETGPDMATGDVTDNTVPNGTNNARGRRIR